MAGRKMAFLKHLGEWGSLVEIVALLHKKKHKRSSKADVSEGSLSNFRLSCTSRDKG